MIPLIPCPLRLRAPHTAVAGLALAAFVFAHPIAAQATTELPAYDAQSVGEAAAGVAHISNGGSLYQNPATLAGIERFSATLVLSPLLPGNEAPLSGNGSREKSTVKLAPLFLVGAAYRVSDRIVLSAAAFPSTGFGLTFKNANQGGEPAVAQDRSMQTLNVELTAGGALSILDNLHVGLAYRLTRAEQKIEHYGLVDRLDLSGGSAFGLHAGLVFEPLESLSIGATWRSKVVSNVKGTLSMLGQDFDARSEIASPHSFKLGLAYRPMRDGRLLLTTGVQYALYADSHEEQVVVTNLGGQEITQVTPLGWHNTLAGGVGSQYFVLPDVAVRVGFSLAQSATPENRPFAFQVPPGWLKSICLGAGYKLTHWDFDVGAFYSFLSTRVAAPEPASTSSGGPQVPERYAGTYGMRLLLVSLGTTFHY